MAKKVFTQHKNGDVSIRLTKEERHKLSALLGNVAAGDVNKSDAFSKLYVGINDRDYKVDLNVLPLRFSKI